MGQMASYELCQKVEEERLSFQQYLQTSFDKTIEEDSMAAKYGFKVTTDSAQQCST